MSTTRFQSRATAVVDSVAPKLHVAIFGGQINKYDSLLVEGRFNKQGHVTTGSLDEADVALFRTCSVGEHPEERIWSWLGESWRAKETRLATFCSVPFRGVRTAFSGWTVRRASA